MIGDRIKSLRNDVGMSQAELARKLSVTRSSVNAWESGFSAPTAQYIIEICSLFHCSSDYVLEINSKKTLDISKYSRQECALIKELVSYFDSCK